MFKKKFYISKAMLIDVLNEPDSFQGLINLEIEGCKIVDLEMYIGTVQSTGEQRFEFLIEAEEKS